MKSILLWRAQLYQYKDTIWGNSEEILVLNAYAKNFMIYGLDNPSGLSLLCTSCINGAYLLILNSHEVFTHYRSRFSYNDYCSS